MTVLELTSIPKRDKDIWTMVLLSYDHREEGDGEFKLFCNGIREY